MTARTKRFVCVHGHFYQPPRENAWLETIESQPSAWPAHDWNERVTEECYAPNARARTLSRGGLIEDITNNYASMSFNFGPTLLSWMQAARPDVYRAILDADREASERAGGPGAAMAQVYNHMILPLANRRDKVTQVRWGIADFTARFGRAPAGMWLAETAVDTESLEVLAEHGVRFTVLAPHQCEAVRPPSGEWRSVSGQRVETRRPYLARLPSGRTIALFFYDGPTSRAVAFERLLNDGYGFAERLLSRFEPRYEDPQLVHIATDGETYGHHHEYGEMALAVALARIEAEPGVELVSYEQLLARWEPTWEARIAEDTSWSCAHGVERWRSDCGCNSGTGWHQRWRAPLRDALDWLRDELAPRFEASASELLTDPWEARDEYIDVVLDRPAADAFLTRHAKRPLEPDERRRALSLLEMQRHAMLMYTSCGWFFDELSNIETVQVLQYAARAVQLASDHFGDRFEAGFLERVGRAPTNREEYTDGLGVFRALVEPAAVNLRKVGAHFAVHSVLDARRSPNGATLGAYACEHVEQEISRTGGARLAIGRARVRSRLTGASADLSYAVLHFGDHNVLGGVRPFVAARHLAMHGTLTLAFARADLTEVVRQVERQFDSETFSLRDLLHDEQAAILRDLLEERSREVEETYDDIYDRSAPLMRFLESLGQPAPEAFKAAAEHTLRTRLRRALAEGVAMDHERVEALLAEAREASVSLDPVALGIALTSSLEALLTAVRDRPEERNLLGQLERVASLASDAPWKMDLRVAQDLAFHLVRERMPAMTSQGRLEDAARVARVGVLLGIDV